MEKRLIFDAKKINGDTDTFDFGQWSHTEWKVYEDGTITKEDYFTGWEDSMSFQKEGSDHGKKRSLQMEPDSCRKLIDLIWNAFPECEAHMVMDGTNWEMTGYSIDGEKIHSVYGRVDDSESLAAIAEILENAIMVELRRRLAERKKVSISIQRVKGQLGDHIQLDGRILQWRHTHRPGPISAGYPESYFNRQRRRLKNDQLEQIMKEISQIPLTELKSDPDSDVIYPGARYSIFECGFEDGETFTYRTRFAPAEVFFRLFAILEKYCKFIPDPDEPVSVQRGYRIVFRECTSGTIYTAWLEEGSSIVIGRDPKCSIFLMEDKTVSRIHCSLSLRNGVLSITDLKSVNGTFLNVGGEWKRVDAGTQIADGDLFRIGKYIMQLESNFFVHGGMRIEYGDICDSSCDAIVNASNGLGDMGGKMGIKKKLPGVAESIHYATRGEVEKEARRICKKQGVFGYEPGNVFVTPAFNLKCKHIIHAVTMRIPGTFTTAAVVEKLLPRILDQARSMGLKSIAIPLLGTGTGKLSEKKVMELYHQAFSHVNDLEIVVYIYKRKATP